MISGFSTVGVSSSPPVGFEDSIALIVIFSLFVIRRIYRGIYGRQYRKSRLSVIPAIYFFLLVFSMFALGNNFILEISVLLLILPGIPMGLRFGSSVKFYRMNETLYYKRSQFILIFWLISFLVREILAVLYPLVLYAILGVDALLALTTGIIIGEAIEVNRAFKTFSQQESQYNGLTLAQK
ncbi:MAG: hypothetical protein QW597_05040 [Thermoplasmataceae archaeon]